MSRSGRRDARKSFARSSWQWVSSVLRVVAYYFSASRWARLEQSHRRFQAIDSGIAVLLPGNVITDQLAAQNRPFVDGHDQIATAAMRRKREIYSLKQGAWSCGSRLARCMLVVNCQPGTADGSLGVMRIWMLNHIVLTLLAHDVSWKWLERLLRTG